MCFLSCYGQGCGGMHKVQINFEKCALGYFSVMINVFLEFAVPKKAR